MSNQPVDVSYQQLFNGLLEAVPLPVFVVDCSQTVHFVNQCGLNLCPIAHLAEPMTLDDMIHDVAIVQLVQESIQSGNMRHGVYDRDGADSAWNVRVVPLASPSDDISLVQQESRQLDEAVKPESQACQYFAVTIEDMAEPRRLERVQRDFIANISHELRTPLSSVRLLAETLEDVIDTEPDKAQAFVEKIETEVQYLSDLVSELLELSRMESGQTPMTIEPVAAERLVREVMARMLPLAQRYRVRLGTDIQEGGVMVAADSKQITRVLFNLVHNAIKFTPSGGMIVIGTALQPDQHIQRFFVRDTGVGIGEEDLSRIFERFYKTDRARAKTDHIGPGRGGTGLGLAIARQVVQNHGGRIIAESVLGQGSTFTFTLPVAAQAINELS